MTQPPFHDQRTVLTDINIPFGRLVAFFVKATFAAIPAFFIVWLIIMVFWMVLAALFGWGGGWMWRMHRWPY